jgi:hypothetical protein
MSKFQQSPVAGMLASCDASAAGRSYKQAKEPKTNHMSTETQGKRIHWTQEEMEMVAAEAQRKFPDAAKITVNNFLEAQSVLPFERRRPSINYSTKTKLLALIQEKPAKRKYTRRGEAVETVEAVEETPAVVPEITSDGALAQVLGQEIAATTLVEIQIRDRLGRHWRITPLSTPVIAAA